MQKMDVGVQRNDLRAEYKDFINQAIHNAQERRSWGCMTHKDTKTLQSGRTFVIMPGDFKELQRGQAPIGILNNQTTSFGPLYLPCRIMSKRELERLNTYGVYNGVFFYGLFSQALNPYQFVNLPIYIDWQDGFPAINILGKASTDITFIINYFKWIPSLEKEEDTNWFTMTAPEMIYNKAMALAFEMIKDYEAAQFHEQLYDKYLLIASRSDDYAQVAGTVYRM